MEKKFTRFNKLKTGERKIRRYRDGAVGSFPSVRNGTFFRTFCYFLITFCFVIRVWNWKLDTVTWIWYSNTFDIKYPIFQFLFYIRNKLYFMGVVQFVIMLIDIFVDISKRKMSHHQETKVWNKKSRSLAFKYSNIDSNLILIWIFLFYFIDNSLFAIFNLL